MGLHFHSLLHRVICIAEHLNGAGAVRLSQACIDQVTHVANKHLRVSKIFLISKRLPALRFLLSISNLTDASVTSCCVDNGHMGAFRLVAGNRTERNLLELEAPRWIWLVSIWVELPDVDHGILAARDESSVILKPADALDRLLMCNKFELLGDNGRVELVDPDFLVVCTGEKMTSVREDDFSALPNRQRFVRHKLSVKDVH